MPRFDIHQHMLFGGKVEIERAAGHAHLVDDGVEVGAGNAGARVLGGRGVEEPLPGFEAWRPEGAPYCCSSNFPRGVTDITTLAILTDVTDTCQQVRR